MKNKTILILLLLISSGIYSQEQRDTIAKNLTNTKWRLEIGFGSSSGIRPFNKGYYASENEKAFGQFNINSYKVGATYNFSRNLGLRADLAFDRFKNASAKSLPFESAQFRTSFQLLVNLTNFLNPQNEDARFNLTFHGGINLGSLITIKTEKNQKIGSPDIIGGVVFGVMPMYRITKKSYIFIDLSSFTNYRQNHSWDGHVSEVNNNLSGQMINGTFGITYSLGKSNNKLVVNQVEAEKITALEKRLSDLEIMMNDTDTDGVPDYLDVENNSIAGVAVDTKGRMFDVNKNGVPDELEKKNPVAIDQTVGSEVKQNENVKLEDIKSETTINQLINDGFVSVYFDSNSIRPTAMSVQGINFMLIYLRKNPTVKLNIVGHSDELGNTKFNNKLAIERANAVKKTLVRAGIEETRLNTTSGGEDQSVDPKYKDARSLVRRVTFELK
jgi:OOP family OmpA-OmpF porin